MACIDIQVRALPTRPGIRVLTWLVTPRRPPLVLDPYPEEGMNVQGFKTGWWALARISDEIFWTRTT